MWSAARAGFHRLQVARNSAAVAGVSASPGSAMAATASKKFIYDYSRPALTVDAILVSEEREPKVLLIQRRNDPYGGEWALPGGFVDEMEPLDKAAARELQEETSVDPAGIELVQTGTYGDPGRDPRGKRRLRRTRAVCLRSTL
jgi:8-oxo-dGTP diphosphatase